MSRPDVYHDAVRHALEKDGGTITFSEPVGQLGAGPLRIPLLVFVPEEEVIEQWIEPENMPPSFDA